MRPRLLRRGPRPCPCRQRTRRHDRLNAVGRLARGAAGLAAAVGAAGLRLRAPRRCRAGTRAWPRASGGCCARPRPAWRCSSTIRCPRACARSSRRRARRPRPRPRPLRAEAGRVVARAGAPRPARARRPRPVRGQPRLLRPDAAGAGARAARRQRPALARPGLAGRADRPAACRSSRWSACWSA